MQYVWNQYLSTEPLIRVLVVLAICALVWFAIKLIMRPRRRKHKAPNLLD